MLKSNRKGINNNWLAYSFSYICIENILDALNIGLKYENLEFNTPAVLLFPDSIRATGKGSARANRLKRSMAIWKS